MSRATRRIAILALALLTAASFAPLVAVAAASITADLLGCRLDEGAAHACRLFGLDLGEALYAGFVLGWLMLVTWPGMLLSLVLWLVVAVRAVRRRRVARAPASG